MAMLALILILQISSGLADLVEGDIAVPQTTKGDSVADAFLSDPSQLWPNGFVPFVFETLQLEGGGEEPIFIEEQKQMIRDSMAHIKEKVPCIQFKEVTKGHSGAHIIFSMMGDDNNEPTGCWAYVGCQGPQGGKSGQTVNYGPGCFNMGTILHESMHSLGATHEQNREDRDRFVKIFMDQIDESNTKNCEKKGATFNSYGTPYDYDSIMHYNEYAFSNNSEKKTIIPLLADINISPVSSKTGLSAIDAMELARVYASVPTSEDCYKKETTTEYIRTVEKMLNLSYHQGADQTSLVGKPKELVELFDVQIVLTAQPWKGGNIHLKIENLKKIVTQAHINKVDLDIDFDSGAEVGDGLFKMAVKYCMVPSDGEEEQKTELLIEQKQVGDLRTIVIDGTSLGEPVKGKISGFKDGDVNVLQIELERGMTKLIQIDSRKSATQSSETRTNYAFLGGKIAGKVLLKSVNHVFHLKNTDGKSKETIELIVKGVPLKSLIIECKKNGESVWSGQMNMLKLSQLL